VIPPSSPPSRGRATIVVVAGVVLIGVLIVGSAWLGTRGLAPPSAPATNLPVPTGTVTPTATEATGQRPCSNADLVATGGPWGGAAGSRGSDVVVVNHGSAACRLPARPAIEIVDRTGVARLASPPASGAGAVMEANGGARFSVVIGNWCDPVDLPLHLKLSVADGTVDIDGLSFSNVDELPPCNGPGQPPSLSTTDWH
jgi:hypothetical protein